MVACWELPFRLALRQRDHLPRAFVAALSLCQRLDVIEQRLASLGAREVLSVPSGGEGQRMESLEPRPDAQGDRARGLLPEGFRVEARFAPPRREVPPVQPRVPGSLPPAFCNAPSNP